MSLKNQIVNYFKFNKDAGVHFFYFEEVISPLDKSKNNNNLIQSVSNNNKNISANIEIDNPNNLNIIGETPNIEISTLNTESKLKKNNILEKSTMDAGPLLNHADENILINSSESNQIVEKNIFLDSISNINTLNNLKNQISNCKNCILGFTRTNLVFGEGNPRADIMIIGEAPGADEDKTGKPFVGKAGKLLTDILAAINFSREDVYIANICKCRPPANRKPTTEEVNICEIYLHKQIEIIKPVFILALGLTAAEALFKKTYKMGEIRGKLLEFRGINTLITYHPAALLRNPNWKRDVWEDVKLLRNLYEEYQKTAK